MEVGTLGHASGGLRALNLIDGRWQPAARGRQGDSLNPATGQEIGSFAASLRADAQQAIAAARGAFERGDWSHNAELRRSVLLEWADRLARRTDLAQLLTLENGKVLAQSRREIAAGIAELRLYGSLAPRIPEQHDADSYCTVLREPAGVAALIVPWQAPVSTLIRSLAPALTAGCTAVIKPAPQSAQITAAVIGELTRVAGVPRGVVNLVSETGNEVAKELVASGAIDVIRFSGSYETGKKIAVAAAPTMKKLLLDLSGKSCCLVFADVDVDKIAAQLAAAAMITSGQQASAARRILVHASRYQETKAALKRALEQIVIGAGDAPGCGMGPLIDAPALVSVGIRTEQALESCDEVLLRGRRLGGALADGFFLSPTLITKRDWPAYSCEEEILGPVVALGQFEDDSEAVALARNMPFALSASVWTEDPVRALRVARSLHNEMVWINDHDKLARAAEARDDYHGRHGRRRGYQGVLDYLDTRHIYRGACAD
jgi:betaine-aldehyde dehydrogenase